MPRCVRLKDTLCLSHSLVHGLHLPPNLVQDACKHISLHSINLRRISPAVCFCPHRCCPQVHVRPHYAHDGAWRLLLHCRHPLEYRRGRLVLGVVAPHNEQEERLSRHKGPVGRAVHAVARCVIDVCHQILRRTPHRPRRFALPCAKRPTAHLDSDGAVVRGARRGDAAHQRIGEAALARALVAKQHELGEIARRGTFAQITQVGQHRAGAFANHVRRRRVQGQTLEQIQLS